MAVNPSGSDTTMQEIPSNTPVLVGAAQFTDRIADAHYEQLSPVAITARAASLALADVGVANLEHRIDLLMTTRTFEDSAPVLAFPFGRSNNFPRSVCQRLNIDPPHAVWATSGGDTPQKMVTEACDRIAAGEVSVALLCGGEALSTGRHLMKTEQVVDWSEEIDAPVDDRGATIDFLTHDELANGLITPPLFHGVMENARRKAAGASVEQWQREMAALFAPLSQVAAGNPYAAQHERGFSVDDLITLGEGNRLVVDPYPQRLIARDQVNQSAALVIVASSVADDLGIPAERRIYLYAQAAAGEQPVTLRPDMGEAPSAGLALRTALERAEMSAADIDLFDFYSCFPIAVSNAIAGLGIDPADPRGLTLTGGLPYFGGPGNSYSMHAIAEAVVRLRSGHGESALIAANGGFLTKYAVGIYGRTPKPYRAFSNEVLDQQMRALGSREIESKPAGEAAIESYTLSFDRGGAPKIATVVATLMQSGARCLARSADGDQKTLRQVAASDPLDRRILIETGEGFNAFAFRD